MTGIAGLFPIARVFISVRTLTSTAGLFGVVLVVILIGCGPSGPTCIPVHGTVTFDGGPCPAGGTITFSPIETPEGIPRRPGSGKFGVDGKFEVTSYAPGDGLLPGRYRVRIECLSGVPPQRLGGFEEVSYIAPGYVPNELVVSAD
ncbi:MAG: hypothetical protein JW829_00590, partial [Pirellulales bacterium]|nr:hypothetical protein [Pirellulales bacterium]